MSQGSSAGPPMLPNYPGWYNNNYTIVQRPPGEEYTWSGPLRWERAHGHGAKHAGGRR